MRRKQEARIPATHYRVLINGLLWDDCVYNVDDLIPRDPARPTLDFAVGNGTLELATPEDEVESNPSPSWFGRALARNRAQ